MDSKSNFRGGSLRGGKWYLENCTSRKHFIQSQNSICDESGGSLIFVIFLESQIFQLFAVKSRISGRLGKSQILPFTTPSLMSYSFAIDMFIRVSLSPVLCKYSSKSLILRTQQYTSEVCADVLEKVMIAYVTTAIIDCRLFVTCCMGLRKRWHKHE